MRAITNMSSHFLPFLLIRFRHQVVFVILMGRYRMQIRAEVRQIHSTASLYYQYTSTLVVLPRRHSRDDETASATVSSCLNVTVLIWIIRIFHLFPLPFLCNLVEYFACFPVYGYKCGGNMEIWFNATLLAVLFVTLAPLWRTCRCQRRLDTPGREKKKKKRCESNPDIITPFRIMPSCTQSSPSLYPALVCLGGTFVRGMPVRWGKTDTLWGLNTKHQEVKKKISNFLPSLSVASPL